MRLTGRNFKSKHNLSKSPITSSFTKKFYELLNRKSTWIITWWEGGFRKKYLL